jgi:hypothetical protein
MEFPKFCGQYLIYDHKLEGKRIANRIQCRPGAITLQVHRHASRSVQRKDDAPGSRVTRAGFYAWCKQPLSNRSLEDTRLLRWIRASFAASHGIDGAPRVFLDLREAGETCSKHRDARLMRQNNLRAPHGTGPDEWRSPNHRY